MEINEEAVAKLLKEAATNEVLRDTLVATAVSSLAMYRAAEVKGMIGWSFKAAAAMRKGLNWANNLDELKDKVNKYKADYHTYKLALQDWNSAQQVPEAPVEPTALSFYEWAGFTQQEYNDLPLDKQIWLQTRYKVYITEMAEQHRVWQRKIARWNQLQLQVGKDKPQPPVIPNEIKIIVEVKPEHVAAIGVLAFIIALKPQLIPETLKGVGEIVKGVGEIVPL